MNLKPYLLFDAGGTLIFPDSEKAAQIGREAGLQVQAQDLAAAHARLFHAFDSQAARERRLPGIQYFPDLFKTLGAPAEQARAAAELAQHYDRERSLWATTHPWVGHTLTKLAAQGFRMSVISNSDGRVEQILRDLHLRDPFEIVIDSQIVGIEKPNRKIFELALRQLNLTPAEAIYIGDIYFVDVWGANQAGIGAIHLDKMGLYAGWGGVRLQSVAQLPEWLAQLDGQPLPESLFSAREFENFEAP